MRYLKPIDLILTHPSYVSRIPQESQRFILRISNRITKKGQFDVTDQDFSK